MKRLQRIDIHASSGKPMAKMGANGTSEITAACNKDCKCSTYLSQPVCGSNNVAYFDPCHAGCLLKPTDNVSLTAHVISACSFIIKFTIGMKGSFRYHNH